MKRIAIRLVLLVFVFSVVVPRPTSAVTEGQFRNEQDIVWQVPCDNTATTAQPASNTQPAGPAAPVTSGSGGGCGNNADGDAANRDQIWDFLTRKFQEKGYSKEEAEKATAGIMGNMQQESTFNPYINRGKGCGSDQPPAVGLVQWCFGRIDNLNAFAVERGKDRNCLGLQLEFVWHEMETDYSTLFGQMKGKSPYDAAQLFDRIYEGSEGTGERGVKAEVLYGKLTGKAPGQLAADTPATPGQNASATNPNACTASKKETEQASSTGGQQNGPIPPGDCGAVLDFVRQINGGKITFYGEDNKKNVEKDLNHCTNDQVSCGGGVNPKIVRAVAAAAQNSGTSTITMWNLNTGHDCDGLNHPNGKAADLRCIGNEQGSKTASDDCNKIFKYLYDNYDALELEELIWQYPPPEYSCNDPKILCYVDGHHDHIHVGVR